MAHMVGRPDGEAFPVASIYSVTKRQSSLRAFKAVRTAKLEHYRTAAKDVRLWKTARKIVKCNEKIREERD